MNQGDVTGRVAGAARTDAARTDAARAAVLIDVEELARLLAGDGTAPVLLDVRWALGRADGREQYLAGHVPGAVYVDLETELAGTATAADGRHPLPDVASLQAAARRWGVSRGSAVVAYDASGGTSAARAWWLLRWAGVTGARLLDGGLDAWRSAGGALELGGVTPAAGDVVLVPGALATLGGDGAAALASTGVLLDARAGERYRGEVEPVDPRAGHIAGAVSAPTAENLDEAGRFLGARALRARFAALGVPVSGAAAAADGVVPGVGVYCGSGVTAAHEVAALATVGIEAALYPGSWSQWSADPTREVTTGADPR
jgi:thiosulfate/3-mercaptopyruvate sulfurtransferase